MRRIGRGFAFIPNRFLHDGFFATLSDAERSLYLFLVLAALSSRRPLEKREPRWTGR